MSSIVPTSSIKLLSVLLLSTSDEINKKISEALKKVHDNGDFRWKLFVVELYKVEDLVKEPRLVGNIDIDFVIFAIDTNNKCCLEWAKKELAQVHSDLKLRRVLLVNGCGLPANAMAISAGELIDFTNEMNLDMITTNVFDANNAFYLARWLLKYIEVCVGVKTGVPNLNI